MKSVDELRRAPFEVYGSMAWGPLTVTRHDERAEVETPDGRRVELSPVTYLGRHLVDDRLRAGAEIVVDGTALATACQARHGLLRRHRVVELAAVDDSAMPDRAIVRLRGPLGAAVMTQGGRTLVRPARPAAVHRRRKLDVDPDLGVEAVLAFVAIEVGLAEALSL